MQELIRRYLDRDLGRRRFVQRMAGMGFTLAAAKAFLEPLDASERAAVHPDAGPGGAIEGTGGELVVAQAKAAGAEYLFTNPGSFDAGDAAHHGTARRRRGVDGRWLPPREP
jgi:DNA-binding transcriptional MerR regulator